MKVTPHRLGSKQRWKKGERGEESERKELNEENNEYRNTNKKSLRNTNYNDMEK